MSFFNNFSVLPYKFDATRLDSKVVVNIMTSAKFKDIFPERSNKCYIDYILKDGEKPEHIAERVYRRPDYHWIVLLSNLVYNPYFDWPMSSSELEAYVGKKYPGVALFYNCIGSEATRFFQSTSETPLLPEEKSHFIVGKTLTQVQTDTNTTVTATIIEWNPTYRKLVVDNVDGGAFSTLYDTLSLNVDDIEFRARPRKIVQENSQALKHFVDDFNNYLDPYAKINYYEYDDNKTYARQNIFYNNDDGIPTSSTIGVTGTNDFMLNKYINGSQSNTITNYVYEEIENDIKRQIKILRPEYIPNILKQIGILFR